MARVNRLAFVAIAVVFHFMYIWSIFDIYFVSPIVTGMREFGVERPPGAEAPAKRLVLFVGDGLRADKAFQSFPDPSPPEPITEADLEPKPLAPFLRSRVLEYGTFGVSHTRVPTESRPGHVALIAGLYEDVSSVTTGWKLNPVNFDSVFNRSRHTWSWGSPDILPMFKEGAVPGRIDAYMYGEEEEDFSKDATALDIWVFDRVKELFASAAVNPTLNAALKEDKIVFFLHLLGLDTSGHGYRPYSKEYLNNIKVVDSGVREITHLIESFYNDGKTAFVFTADHGMSDYGSHGDGHPDNTRTPLIVWGSGVAKPVISTTSTAEGHEDGFSSDWGLSHVRRNDVAQADVAALMAYLLGVDFPVNSVGELPLAYVAADAKEKAEALLANARELMEMYRVKEENKKASELRYKPFPPLGDIAHSVEHRITEIRRLIDGEDYDTAIEKTVELMKLGLEGLRYLQTYDWLFLRALVTAGYLGWIAFALTTVIDLHVLKGEIEASRTAASISFFSSLLVALYAVLWFQRAPWTYYAYAIFPVAFWEEVFGRRRALKEAKSVLLSHVDSAGGYAWLALKALAFIGLLEALVQAYFHREVFTVCFLLAIFWPAFYGKQFLSDNTVLVATWAAACVTMSTFTLLPAVKVEDLNLILFGGFLMFMVGLLYLVYEDSIVSSSMAAGPKNSGRSANIISRVVLGVQTGLIALAILVTKSSVESLKAKTGLPFGNEVVGWIVLVSSLITPFFHALQPNSYYLHRLIVIFLTFSPIFIILTISYEGLFYLAFCATLVTWVRLEHRIYTYTSAPGGQHSTATAGAEELNVLKPALAATQQRLNSLQQANYRALTLSDARLALFFFFLLQSAFFSTGNVASLSSFSMDSVQRLIPVFNPFSQAALLILQLMIPFAVISANLGILNRRLGVAPSALFMLVMAISDVMTLNFFYMVKDEGSWLDIGTTISHFCIASLLCVFVAGLEFISEIIVSGVEVESERLEKTQRTELTNGQSRGAKSSQNGTGGLSIN